MTNEIQNKWEPKVGDGATICYWSDREACTVIEVKSPRCITIQRDIVKLLNGADSGEPDALKVTPGGFVAHTEGVQRWECIRGPLGRKYEVTLRKNGKWILRGDSLHGTEVIAGRHEHYDYNY
jgi:hypothetical protein